MRVLPASEPASGSVSPKAASRSPDVRRGHPLLLLLLRAEQVDRLGAERGVGAERDRDGGVDARELLDRDGVGERVGAGTPVLLRERDPHPAELAQLADDLVRERLGAVELGRDRGDLALGEVADGVAKRLVLLGQVEDHCASVPLRAQSGEPPGSPEPPPPVRFADKRYALPSPRPLRGQVLRALFELHEDLAAPDRLALGHVDGAHDARPRRGQRHLHLHRLDDDEGVPRLDLVARLRRGRGSPSPASEP